MKSLTTLLLICIFAPAFAQQIQILKNPDGSVDTLVLEFNEDFNSNKLDEKIWKIEEGVTRDPEGKHSLIWNTKNNIEIKDGICKLVAKRDTMMQKEFYIWVGDGMKPFKKDFYFSSAEISTHKQYGYGLYEIRCRIPKGKGLWPAFWMYGSRGKINCEIDVFEFWNQRGFLTRFSKRKMSRVHNMTAHYNGGMTQRNYTGPDFSEDFHVFTTVWDECRVDWYMDGKLMRRLNRYAGMDQTDVSCFPYKEKNPNAKENVFPKDQLMNIIADLAVFTDESQPEPTTPFPASMDMDYIRYYRFK